MGKDDYSSTGGGLKLKGAKPTGIEKKRKKKPATSTIKTDSDDVTSRAAQEKTDHSAHQKDGNSDNKRALAKAEDAENLARRELDMLHKTETERRHEEMRRKRLNDRLAREGSKTHKERVEELNKYLSGLSEHHDMPRIGPG